jgi:3-oxoacyl-[acyl-carrier protein] reductase
MKFKGKVAVVTGGARDLGRAISLKLASEGAKVVINYFDNEPDAQETQKMIQNANGECIIVKGDMTKWADVQHLEAEAVKNYGNDIHILVNVVGGLVGRKPIEEQDEAWYNFLMDVNMKTCFFVTKAFVPHMPAGSAIVNFSSQAARDGGGPGASLYATAKGAVMTYTRSCAKEFGPRGIRVNALSPGMINTSFHDRFTKPEVRTAVASSTPLRREGVATEIADAVCFLASEESGFVTGVNLDINGGTFFS